MVRDPGYVATMNPRSIGNSRLDSGSHVRTQNRMTFFVFFNPTAMFK